MAVTFIGSRPLYEISKKHGLSTAYMKKGSFVRTILQKVLGLYYLPSGDIPDQFRRLENTVGATGQVSLLNFFDYVRRVWIEGRLIRPENWSVFNRPIRTNNDCEGLHNRWNQKSRNRRNYYWILSIIGKETRHVDRDLIFVHTAILERHQSRSSQARHKSLFDLRDEYRRAKWSASVLLEKVVNLVSREYPTFTDLNGHQDFPSELDLSEDFDPYT